MKKEQLNLPYFNSTNFPIAVSKQLTELEYSETEARILKYHQFIVKEYFTRTNSRGLLICHGMGQGKTRLSISIADYIRTFDKRNIIVLSSKSLETNFKKEIIALGKDPEHYTFISLNSNNMFKQISNVDKSEEEIALEKKLGDFMNDVIKKSSLEGSLLIIDEAHNLFNAITNGAKNAVLLYDLIMNTKNLKLIFMSGTPIINDPFELVPCFNMIRGTKTPLFSEDIEDFDMYFVDRENKTIKNKPKFLNRIFGLCSYYGDLYFSQTNQKKGFPKELDTIVEKVPMSETQFARYLSARLLEQEETKKAYRSKESRFSSSTGGSSTYRVKSRQISNYCIPEYALGPVRGLKSREKFINKITEIDLQNTKEFSPKMGKIIENISKHSGSGLVYSQFVSGEGIKIFSRILETSGLWKEFGDVEAFDQLGKPKKIFAILSGSIDPEDRSKIINNFNQKNSEINLLLLSGALAEGIDLKRVRHVHIMEPFWNYTRINQVKTRAIRYLSHDDLPEDQQNVQIYIYLSDYPIGYPKSKIKELTTDIDLYNSSIDNMQIIDSFILALAEASIDCAIHHPKLSVDVQNKIKCQICSPSDEQLFHPILNRDMLLPSPCKPLKEKKISVKLLNLPIDEKIYYTGDMNTGIKLFYWDKKLNGYNLLPRTHKYYSLALDNALGNTLGNANT